MPKILQITKEYIDRYKPGKMIPYCQLSADFESKASCKGEIPLLFCHVDVIGARKPRKFAIKPPPPPLTSSEYYIIWCTLFYYLTLPCINLEMKRKKYAKVNNIVACMHAVVV